MRYFLDSTEEPRILPSRWARRADDMPMMKAHPSLPHEATELCQRGMTNLKECRKDRGRVPKLVVSCHESPRQQHAASGQMNETKNDMQSTCSTIHEVRHRITHDAHVNACD